MKQSRFKTHLILPDAHAKPGVDNRRFEWLGKYIVDLKPDVFVCIGDFADMESLSSYDKGKKSFEGRRYKKDVEVTHDALEKLFKPLDEYNNIFRKMKKKKYQPHTVMTVGNHEHRTDRAVELSPELDGTLSVADLRFEKYFDIVAPFRTPVVVDGISYCHYFGTGVMGKAVSGEAPAAKLIKTQFTSCIQGHSHLRDFAERTDAHGKRIQGLIVGCYTDPDQWEDYAGQSNLMWWKGVVVLTVDTITGTFDPQFISIEQLKEKYENNQ